MIWENNILLIYYGNAALSSFICKKRARARKRMRVMRTGLAKKRNRARYPESTSEETEGSETEHGFVMGQKKRPDYFFFAFAAGFFAGAGAGFAAGFVSAFFAGAGAGFAAGFASAFFAGAGAGFAAGFASAFFAGAGAGFAAGFASAFFARADFFSAFFTGAGAVFCFADSAGFNESVPVLTRCLRSALPELNMARKPSLVMGTVIRRKTSCS